MSGSPPPSSSAIPPSSSSASQPPPPPSSLSPPPAASPPPISQPNATSDPPQSPPPSPPPVSTAPPPSIPSPPPSIPSSPPPSSPPPPVASTPPTAANAPPPTSPPPPSPTVSSPPPSASLPTPTLSPPPSASPPPPSLPSSPPPTPPAASPPPVGSPPVTVPPPTPAKSQSPPPPPSASPPTSSSQPPPPSASPPTSSSQPPPLPNPPTASPPPPVGRSPPPSGSQTPPLNPPAPPPRNQPPSLPSAPPPKNIPPSVPSTPSPPPSNSSDGVTPAVPSVPSSPALTSPPPLPSPTTPSGDPATPISPGFNRSSEFSRNATIGRGGSNSTGSGGINTGTGVSIAVVAGLLILSLVGAAVWFVRRRRRHAGGYNAGFVMPSPFTSTQMSDASPRSPVIPPVYHSSGSQGFVNSSHNQGLGNSKSWFTYEELHEITHGFSTKNLLGEGGFGCVYKGCLPDGREVAVKQLKVGGGQGEREFKAEVEIISRVHHRHLVSLVGYCISESQRLLVYDFVPNDTLDYHLHGVGRPVMDWATRVKVAAGAARGIAYLHEDCHPRIIHRDIKSSNILLDNSFEAQVSDFGLARLAMDAATHITTRVMGTFGYLAPEYASTGKLTDRSDVYSFGVVLLELITGRKPVDVSQPMGDESLVEWARPLLTRALDTGDLEGLPDPRLENNYNESEMFRMIEAAAACVRHSASMRPRMGLVVRALDSLAEADLNNGMRPGQSELFAAPQSAEIRMFQRMAFGSQDYSSDLSRSSWKSRSGL